jgi:hypothetical protein
MGTLVRNWVTPVIWLRQCDQIYETGPNFAKSHQRITKRLAKPALAAVH